nr:hypothetical protein [Escherichia coli]
MIIKPYLVCRCFRFSLKKEAAQSLYIYFEAMPAGTLFVSMKRLRERLLLTTPVRTQNQIIRKAMLELKSIGYLEYQEVKKGRDIQFQIFLKRSPKTCSGKNTVDAPGIVRTKVTLDVMRSMGIHPNAFFNVSPDLNTLPCFQTSYHF